MSATTTLPAGVRETVPHGTSILTVWTIAPDGLAIMWHGHRSRLRIGYAWSPGATMSSIDHPAACDRYDTRSEARAAVVAFLAAGDAS